MNKEDQIASEIQKEELKRSFGKQYKIDNEREIKARFTVFLLKSTLMLNLVFNGAFLFVYLDLPNEDSNIDNCLLEKMDRNEKFGFKSSS